MRGGGGISRSAADNWFSKCVRHRDRNTCQYCQKEGNEAAHIYGRAKKSTRWSMDNAVTLCNYHHRYFTAHPLDFHDWLLKLYGEGHLELLREKANSILKTNALLRKEISAHYRGELRKAEKNPLYEIVSYN